GVTAPRADLPVPGVYGIDGTGESVSRQRIHRLSAGSRGIGARADDRDPARVEQSLELRHRGIERGKGNATIIPAGACPAKRPTLVTMGWRANKRSPGRCRACAPSRFRAAHARRPPVAFAALRRSFE